MRNLARLALLIIYSLSAPAQSLGDRWVVVGIVGKWHSVSHPDAFRLGQSLEPGTSFVRDPPNARSGSITLAWDKDTRETHACDNPGDCDKLFKVPAAPVAHTSSGWFREILATWVHEPKRYVAAVSRDSGSLQDAVARTSAAGADLAPVLSGLGKGTYWFRIERMETGRGATVPIGKGPVTLSWDPGHTGSAIVPGLKPGLYRVQSTNQQGEATGGDAWVLVPPPQEFAKAEAAFREIVEQTATWREDVPPAGLRAIHRARLEMLAR